MSSIWIFYKCRPKAEIKQKLIKNIKMCYYDLTTTKFMFYTLLFYLLKSNIKKFCYFPEKQK